MRLNGVNAELKIYKEPACICFLLFEVFENEMYKSVDGIVCTTFFLVRDLEWIKYTFNVIVQFSGQ